MPKFIDSSSRDLVLFVGSYLPSQRQALHRLSELRGYEIRALVLVEEKSKFKQTLAKDPFATVLKVQTKSPVKIAKALHTFEDRILAVTARSEANIPLLKKIIPHVPYVYTPTDDSLDWSTQKILMRKLLKNHDRSISPKFVVVNDASSESIDKIEKKVGYPVIVKPSGLAASLLVSICYHREELETTLRRSIRKIRTLHKEKSGRGEAQLLVEEFMEGSMYSIDAYVNARGRVYFAPPVHISTGRAIGFDDFFGYKQMTPVKLKPHKIKFAQQAATSAIKALSLRNTSCHVELMKTEDGWKVIELAPRIGGYRQELYKLSRGMDHSLNDIMIRIPMKPIIPKKVKGYAVALKIYARNEGKLEKINGRKKIRKLESFKRLKVGKSKGDRLTFAKHGGDPVMEVILFNKNRSKLLADIRRLETSTNIAVSSRGKTTKA